MNEQLIYDELAKLQIETPSWAYGNSGTRFGVFPWPGAARDVYERIEDAALVHKLTGTCPTVALHIPWDRVGSWDQLGHFAAEEGVRIGAINPNLFEDDRYRLGSLCNPDPTIREIAVEHCLECIEIAQLTGSRILSLWLPDGTNYPGQDNLANRFRRLSDALGRIYGALPGDMRLLVEYKFFEPAFYSTDLPDWGTAALVCRSLGERAQVLIDTGHHPQGTNVEQIVALLLEQRLLGGFHFNSRKYADDDLIAGSIDPFELFRIMVELTAASRDLSTAPDAHSIALMIDQAHNVEGKIDAVIQSVMNIQAAYAKALGVDHQRLQRAQLDGDVLGAHRILHDAFETDVRPVLARYRQRIDVSPDPVDAYRGGGYHEERIRRRTTPAGR